MNVVDKVIGDSTKSFILVPGYNFNVFVNGIFKVSFSKISSISYESETEPLIEGGVNDYVFPMRKQKTQPNTMVFEQGVISNFLNYPHGYRSLTNMMAAMYGRVFRPGRRLDMPIFILVNDNMGIPRKFYTVNGVYIKKWSLSDLDASSSSVLIQRFEIEYQDIDVDDITMG